MDEKRRSRDLVRIDVSIRPSFSGNYESHSMAQRQEPLDNDTLSPPLHAADMVSSSSDVACEYPLNLSVISNAAVRNIINKSAASSEKAPLAGLAEKLTGAG